MGIREDSLVLRWRQQGEGKDLSGGGSHRERRSERRGEGAHGREQTKGKVRRERVERPS